MDLSYIDSFEVELGSSLKHRRHASRKLHQLAINAIELKLNNQVRYFKYLMIIIWVQIVSYLGMLNNLKQYMNSIT